MLIDWFTVAAQALNFLLLVWLLKRFLYRPILAAIAEREKRIATELQDAEKKKTEALNEQAEFRHDHEEFEHQRSALLLDATNGAATERERLLESARKDSEELRSKLQKSVYAELENLNRKIGLLAQQEVFAITRKTLADLADGSLEERMIRIFIHRLHDLNQGQREELKASLHASSGPALVRSAFELAPAEKTALNDVLKPLFDPGTGIEFEIRPDLISGVELVANGQKVAWSIADYLRSLTGSMGRLLEPAPDPVPAPAKAVSHAL